MLTRDTLTGGVMLVLSLILIAATHGLPGASPLVPVGPGAYPRVVLGATAVLSLFVLASGLRAALGKKPPEFNGPGVQFGTRNYVLVAVVFVVFGLYVVLLPLIGFRLSTLLFVGVLQAVLEPPKDPVGWCVLVAVAIITALGAHLLFERGLGVLLPRGTFLKL